MFAAPATQEGISNCLNFVKISVKNNTSLEKEARVVVSLRGKTAEKGHEIEISLDFLENNRSYQMTMFTDGLNAGL